MSKNNLQLPDEIQRIIDEVNKKEEQEYHNIVEEVKQERKGEWDVKIDDPIDFFDLDLSYELTGYKPINKTQGLDFDPSWFTESRETFLRTGSYTAYRSGTKGYSEFWDEEYRRCRDGLTVNGYTVTGDHYYFLNYYQLMDLSNTEKAGAGRQYIFPILYIGQYEMFHYFEMAKRLRLNALVMKAREIGYSETIASLLVNSYNCRRNTINVACGSLSDFVDKLMEKVWGNMAFINDHTQGGFFKLRQVIDKQDKKRASYYKIINGQKVEAGWMSQIEAKIIDKPGKLRGDRTDLLVFDEVGLWPGLTKAYTQSDALVGQIGSQWGCRILGGTAGTEGKEIEGLRKMFYSPKLFGILPFRNHYTSTGEEALTGFFIPCTKIMKDRSFLDNRGFADPDKARAFYEHIRELKAADPQELMVYTSEYPFNFDEAFNLEGVNKFSKLHLAEQLTKIRALKQCPNIDTGFFRFIYKNKGGRLESQNVESVQWQSSKLGKVRILEHPLWVQNQKGVLDEDSDNSLPTEPLKDLYVCGVDGIDLGQNDTSSETRDASKFCIVVKRRAYGLRDPKYVAIYKSRPDDLREAYEIAIGLAMYYNAQINIEATRISLLTWSRDRKFLHYFMKRPSSTYNDITKRKATQYGSPATPAVIDHATDLIKDFINDYYYDMWFEDMLDELNRYNDENKRKFDIVAAMNQCELADEELSGTVPRVAQSYSSEFQDFGYYYDENGYKHYGVIPKQNQFITNYTNNFYNEFSYRDIKTSDPRFNW